MYTMIYICIEACQPSNTIKYNTMKTRIYRTISFENFYPKKDIFHQLATLAIFY